MAPGISFVEKFAPRCEICPYAQWPSLRWGKCQPNQTGLVFKDIVNTVDSLQDTGVRAISVRGLSLYLGEKLFQIVILGKIQDNVPNLKECVKFLKSLTYLIFLTHIPGW